MRERLRTTTGTQLAATLALCASCAAEVPSQRVESTTSIADAQSTRSVQWPDAEQSLSEAEARKQAEARGGLTNAMVEHDATQAPVLTEAETRDRFMQERLSHLANVHEDEQGTVLTLSADRLFAPGDSALLPTAEAPLDELSKALMGDDGRSIRIEGFTDSLGSAKSNMVLSQRRADTVRRYLVSRGYEPDLVKAEGRGESRPLASNDDREGRASNRRVEVVIQPTAEGAR